MTFVLNRMMPISKINIYKRPILQHSKMGPGADPAHWLQSYMPGPTQHIALKPAHDPRLGVLGPIWHMALKPVHGVQP